jgi:uncharacterized protein YkwD
MAVAAVAGCGGGGDSATSMSAPSPGVGSANLSTTCNLPNFISSVLARVNQARAAGADCGSEGSFGPAAGVVWNDRLAQAAEGHSLDMQANNYFSHTSLDGRTLAQRVDATGYAWIMLGENIAAGQPTIESVVSAWMASPGHCANVMRPQFSEMGVACVAGTSANTYATYWTMELGQPR